MIKININRERLIMLGVAAFFGIVAVFMVRSYIKNTTEEYKARLEEEAAAKLYGTEIDAILIASKDIPQDTVIAADMLEQAKIPKKFVQPYAIASAQAQGVVGKYTIAPIIKGEQIVSTKLAASQEEAKKRYATMSLKTPAGKRALTIEMDRLSGAGGFVNPGDYVDILWTFGYQTEKERQTATVTLLQNILVLDVGYGGEKESKERAVKENFPVTLALAPLEASTLLFAKENGRLQLLLRPKSDVEVSPVAPMSMEGLLNQILPQAVRKTQEPKVVEVEPPKEEPAPTVEIYRGLEKEIVTVPKSEDER